MGQFWIVDQVLAVIAVTVVVCAISWSLFNKYMHN
jgi:hypothetical protein